MRGGGHKQGYTIVEVMVFLAVSGFMFVLAGAFVSGRQARSEFQQGMNSINSQIQQVASDVSNGFYPSSSNFACSADALGNAPTFPSGSAAEGTNQGCAFIGKTIQFGVGSANSPTYNIYTIVGRQFQTDSKTLLPPANFQQIKAVALTGNGGSPDLTQTQDLEWGLSVDHMYDNDTSHPIGALGFFAGFATNSGGNLDSGAAAPTVIAIPGSQLGQTKNDMSSQVTSLSSPATVIDTSPNITMCFRGGARQYGRLTLGTSDNVQGQKLATHIQISTGAPTGICPP